MRRIVLGTSLLLIASTAMAADRHPIEQALDQCLESPEGMSTHGQRACLDQATQSWDRELNRLWAELMKALPDAAKTQLRSSQRLWISFRDAEILALESSYGAMDGTMYQVMYADAVSSLTRDRVRQLDALLEAQRSSVQ